MSSIQPPVPPRIPQTNIQSLIPRLTTTINDIDSFRALLANGSHDGTMPNWYVFLKVYMADIRDVTLQRYSVLLGRITALSEYISQPPPNATGAPPLAGARPNLESYITHPLNPLPNPDEEGADKISPYASDVYFQVLNTLPIPQLSEAQADLLGTGSGWTTKDGLRGLGEVELDRLEGRLKARLEREGGRARGLKDEIERKREEVDWLMRVDEEEEGEDGSLFGDDEDDGEGGDKDEAMPDGMGKDKVEPVNGAPNPREGWTIQDYVKFMETGTEPKPNSI